MRQYLGSGTNSAARNLISGNAPRLLIAADGGSGAIARGTVVQGNFIGTDATERPNSATSETAF